MDARLIGRLRARCAIVGISHFGLLLGLGLLTALFALPAKGAVGDIVTTALPIVAPDEFNGDLSNLPQAPLWQGRTRERVYRPLLLPPPSPKTEVAEAMPEKEALAGVAIEAAMPSPTQSFEGIARTDICAGGQCGNGTPPDTNGEVGASHYIQAVNSAYGIFSKTGTLLAAFTEDQLWSGNGTICNGQSQGDPVVIYDALADRWILAHFAFGLSGSDTVTPYYECIAVSKTSDPVAGGWWLYPVRVDDPNHPWLNDYSKFGIWSDCLYMSANEFSGAGTFQGTLFASFSRADMYAGVPLTSSIGYIVNSTDPFSMVPSHLGGQAGAAVPPGTPNYFVSESQTAFAFEVRKFTAGPNCGAGGTLSTPTNVSQTSYTVPGNTIVPQPGTTNKLDSLGERIMQKVQYRKIGAQESLWVAHTFRASAAGVTGIQWAQIDVTGGTVSTPPLQQQKYNPADTLYRFMPSLAVDGQGNMALGYSTSNGTAPNYPSIAYSGRLATDPANALPQSETMLIAGSGSQTGNCGGAPCGRWGDYSAMSVDPVDDCTFWYTSEYYSSATNGSNSPPLWQTRIGSFKFPACVGTTRIADLAITMTDDSLTTAPGAAIAYTILVTNNGPFAVTGATVTDTVPAAITGVTWTCAASTGNSCPASGGGSINTSAVNLRKGGTATFTINGTVSPLASGTLTNTATVVVPAGFTDPTPANNAATDTDTVVLSISPPIVGKGFDTSPIVVGQTSLLTITVTNPNAATALTGVAFSDSLPVGVTAPNASASLCGGAVTVDTNVVSLVGGTLAAASNCLIPVAVAGAQAKSGAWTNTINSVTSIQGGTNSTPASANITVNKAATMVAIISDLPDPSVVGHAYMVTYSVGIVAPGAGTPTGTVIVSDGTASCIGTLPATNCQLTSSSVGAKTITATYAGDGNFNGSVSPSIAHTVNIGSTTTSLGSSNNPSVFGQPVTLTATVTGSTPTGTVTFNDGVPVLCAAVPLVGGQATCMTGALTIGGHSITATYSGDAMNAGSTSDPLVQNVTPITFMLNVSLHGSGTGAVSSAPVGIACPGDCMEPYDAGTDVVLTAVPTGGSVFTGWLGGGCSGTSPTCTVSISAPTTVTATFAQSGIAISLDIDLSAPGTQYDALTDGLLIVRNLFGLSGASLIGGAVGPSATRTTATQIGDYLNDIKPALDVDGNGQADALTDGLLIVRYLFGLRGSALIAGAVDAAATRTTAELIEAYLQTLLP